MAGGSQGINEIGFPGIWSYKGATVDAKEGGEAIEKRQTNIYARILGQGYPKELWRLGILSMAAFKYIREPESKVAEVYEAFKNDLKKFFMSLGLAEKTAALL